ncbi:MAG: hypothetical protein ABIL58_24525 [Pseudomonadota bacterium]
MAPPADDDDTKSGRIRQPSTEDLRGKQSVRATFKLSPRAITAISVMSLHLGIKQKSLFDHLMDDPEALDAISRSLAGDALASVKRVQKTYVLSRSALACLERAVKAFGAPRDALVEFSIQRLLPLIEQERQRHTRRKEVLERFRDHVKQGEDLLDHARQRLGADDPVCDRLESALNANLLAYRHIVEFIEKGNVIDDF